MRACRNLLYYNAKARRDYVVAFRAQATEVKTGLEKALENRQSARAKLVKTWRQRMTLDRNEQNML